MVCKKIKGYRVKKGNMGAYFKIFKTKKAAENFAKKWWPNQKTKIVKVK